MNPFSLDLVLPVSAERASELMALCVDRMVGEELVRLFGDKPEELACLLADGVTFPDADMALRGRYYGLAAQWGCFSLPQSFVENALDFIPSEAFARVSDATCPGARAKSLVQRLLYRHASLGTFVEGRVLLLKALLIRARACGVI